MGGQHVAEEVVGGWGPVPVGGNATSGHRAHARDQSEQEPLDKIEGVRK